MDSSTPNGPNPGLIMQLALAYRASAVFFAASDLEVFSHIGNDALTAADVASRCGAATEPFRLVLETCADAGLLQRDGDRFRNTPTIAHVPDQRSTCVPRRLVEVRARSVSRLGRDDPSW